MPDRLRVLVLEPAGNLWGSERALLDLLRGVGDGADLAVCCPPHSLILEPLHALPVTVYPTFVANLHRAGRIARLRAAAGLLLAALHFRPSVIHVNQAGATRIALLVGRVLRVPVVAHIRITEDIEYLAEAGRNAAKLVCISPYVQDVLEARDRSLARRAVTLRDAYASRNPPHSPVSVAETAPPVLMCVGRITPIKGQDVLLRALRVLRDRNVEVRAVFLGEGIPGETFASEIRDEAFRLGLTGSIEWAGLEHDVVGRIAGSAALVCPSHSEPLGRVVLEAWDAGTVPVAWRGSGGPAHVIEASGGGVLYEEQEGESLADTLQRVLSLSPEGRVEMVRRGRAWLLENLDPARYGAAMVRVWEEAA